MLFDSHCHLDFPGLVEDLDGVLARMGDAGVDEAVCIAVSRPEWPRVLALADDVAALCAEFGTSEKALRYRLAAVPAG